MDLPAGDAFGQAIHGAVGVPEFRQPAAPHFTERFFDRRTALAQLAPPQPSFSGEVVSVRVEFFV